MAQWAEILPHGRDTRDLILVVQATIKAESEGSDNIRTLVQTQSLHVMLGL